MAQDQEKPILHEDAERFKNEANTFFKGSYDIGNRKVIHG